MLFLIIIILLAFLLQSLVSGLLGDSLVPPDLIYLCALLLAARTPPYAGLPLAFAVGVLQDLLSAGYPGLHGVGLLFAAYGYYRLSRLVHWDEPVGRMVILGGSYLAKWIGLWLVAFWMRLEAFNPLTLWPVILPEMVLTLLAAPFFFGIFRRWKPSP
ncbi:MAG: rod shape-determining protein MreD [Meiothermus sp.]|nr:rod shape-determining protein MreD [Meiothermus sp.]